MHNKLNFLRRYKRRPAREARERTRGQSLVEFSLIGVVLFAFLMGIMDGARLLFTYSVVSNAAQEGVRYGVLRPRDMLGQTEATQIAQNATLTPTAVRRTYIDAQVVADNACSAFSKTRENAFGLTRSGIQVSAWYDAGDGAPLVINTATPGPLENAAIPGNRFVVEARYHFDFVVPYMKVFVPNGIDVTMRSARTIMSRGDSPNYNCFVNYTPAPTNTATFTPSATPTSTYTPTPTATNTPTITPTPTATPLCGLDQPSAWACRTSIAGGGQPWQAYINVRGFQAGDVVRVGLNSSGWVNMTCTSSGACSYTAGTGAKSTDTVNFQYVPANGRSCGPLAAAVNFSANACGVSTATPTFTPSPTPTPPCPLTASASAVRGTNSGFVGKMQVKATIRDGLGQPARGLTVTARTSMNENIALSEISPGVYSGCSSIVYSTGATASFTVAGTICGVNWAPGPSVTAVDGSIASCP